LPVAYLPTPGFRPGEGFSLAGPRWAEEYHKLTEAAKDQTSAADEVMKTTLLILFLILPAAALTQELKPRAVEPIRVELAVDESDNTSVELQRLIRERLKANRAAVFPSNGRLDYSIMITADALDPDTRCAGYLGALVAVDTTGRPRVKVFTGSDMSALADLMAKSIAARFTR
jgi:hypothetical protein